MISMPMRRHDGVQVLISDDVQKSIIVVGGVDEQAGTAGALQQESVVVDWSDADLDHRDCAGQSCNQRRSAWFDVVDALHQNAGSWSPSAPVTAEASLRPNSQPSSCALLPLTATGPPTLPTAVVKPLSAVSSSLGKSSRSRSRNAHHSSSHSTV